MTLVYILIAIVMIGFIIFFHELGHFVAGRLSGIGVTEFAVGMGPRLCGFEKNGTKYSLRLIPLGGFCAFVGEDEASDKADAMNNVSAWKRVFTVAAGPFMNLLLALILTVILISTNQIYNAFEKTAPTVPQIGSVVDNSAAQEAGIMPGDLIVAVNGSSIDYSGAGADPLQTEIQGYESGAIVLTVERNGDIFDTELVPRYSEADKRMLIGITYGYRYSYAEYDCNVLTAIPEAGKFMFRYFAETIKELGKLVGRLITGSGVESGTVTGVVGMVSNVSSDLSTGFAYGFSTGITEIGLWIMVISLSLGIMNLLPFPALDGGRLILLIIEAVTGKHLKRELEGYINLAGFALLLALMLIVTYSDIRALFK